MSLAVSSEISPCPPQEHPKCPGEVIGQNADVARLGWVGHERTETTAPDRWHNRSPTEPVERRKYELLT